MRNYIILFFALQFGIQLNAQPLDNTASDAILGLANELYQSQDYYNALKKYEQYYREIKDSGVAYKIANINEQLRDYQEAERWFGRIANTNTPEIANLYMPEVLFKYAQMLKMNSKYVESKTIFQKYIDQSDNEQMMERAMKEIVGCDLANELGETQGLSIQNIGENVNSKYSEYSPILVGEDEMYFTAINANKVIVLEYAKEDFYSKAFVSIRTNGKWGKPYPLNEHINQEGYHIGNICLTEDGKTLYFTRVLLHNNIPIESKLYYTKKEVNGWGRVYSAEGLNGDYLVRQPAVGKLYGRKVIFFTADIQKKGQSDIYYSTMKNGSFTKPRSLSETINTDEDEETPFFRDGTLYFSSRGHAGFGGFDIFSSTWDGSKWSEPVNMGKGYNSSVDDLYFSINQAGNEGFLVSNRPGNSSIHGNTCCNDIWSFTKREMDDLLANITEEEKKSLPGATITLAEKNNNLTLEVKPRNGATVEVNNASNINKNYKTVSLSTQVKRDELYTVIIQKAGYIGDTLNIDASGVTESSPFQTELFLIPAPQMPEFETYTINEPIELKNIFYEFNKSDITTSAEKDLQVLLELMNTYPDMVIEISSHTDSRGEAVYNQDLSQKRAEAARAWLINREIDRNRIRAIGYGESKLRNKCDDGTDCNEEEHRFNRRTEFKIIAGPSDIQIEKTRLKGN